MSGAQPLLDVRGLRAAYPGEPDPVPVLHGIDFSLAAGESVGIVGETGSGKTTFARCLLGLLDWEHVKGSIAVDGIELFGLGEEKLQTLRATTVAMSFQGGGGGLNPVMTAVRQVAEPMVAHLDLSKSEAHARALHLLELVELPSSRANGFAHQLSGGERQRVMIAMAIACDPRILVVDEPTTGLDVVTKDQVLDLLARLTTERSLALIVISHDLSDIRRLTDSVAVLYGGRIQEAGPTGEVLREPTHPYTWGLVAAYPSMESARDLRGISGTSSLADAAKQQCSFVARCPQAVKSCETEVPPLVALAENEHRQVACHRGGLVTLVQTVGLTRRFPGRGRNRDDVVAVNGVDLRVRAGEMVALVGASGSGKTTLGRLILGLDDPDDGQVLVDGVDLSSLSASRLRDVRARVQGIFQEPMEALSPRLTVSELVREPLDIQKVGSHDERHTAVKQALTVVSLPTDEEFLARLPHQLSGGQAQRVVIARALVLQPTLLVADEPASALDPSEQAKLMNLFKRLQSDQGVGILLISHDLPLVRKVADRIAVMHQGRVVEDGPSANVLARPKHEWTKKLIEISHRLS